LTSSLPSKKIPQLGPRFSVLTSSATCSRTLAATGATSPLRMNLKGTHLARPRLTPPIPFNSGRCVACLPFRYPGTNSDHQLSANTYPTLYSMAMDYLPTQASSVPSERVFSSSAETDTVKRNKLNPITVEALQMLKFGEVSNRSLRTRLTYQ
jgi:hypothetical protein